jgi:1-acyl-sn-glycerol-3-phosphate acyltransferase
MPRLLRDLAISLFYGLLLVVFPIGFRLRVEGRSRIPETGPVLLIANHQSFLDIVLLAFIAPRRVTFLARKSLFRHGWFRFLERIFGMTVPVDQEGIGKEGLKTMLGLLDAGQAVIVFPEGERTWNGELADLKPGITLLVNRVSAPIVPIGIAGAFEAWPRTRALPSFGPAFLAYGCNAVAIKVGEPISSQKLKGKSRDQILAELTTALSGVLDRARKLRRRH